ncbi:MAG: vitamin B12-dependent ribonucleotide reductase [Nanoarchaeota archaeon]|nr:vitamin B12-dependent ribonucleotide reductase [Nanoarchaeota archaeon]
MITQIKKRNKKTEDFDQEKITEAIWKAAQSVGGTDKIKSQELSNAVVELLNKEFQDQIPTVEQIQDTVEKALIENGHVKTAKSYILYRQRRRELREVKSMIGVEDDVKLPINSLKVLEGRYLMRDTDRNICETPKQLFQRVAANIASADKKYNQDSTKPTMDFYNMMVTREFLPNSPTLMNAGTSIQQLAGCFVLPVEDSMDKIFDAIKYTALIHQSGGGTGFSFSRLRPKGDLVKSTGGVASGPISFMRVFNAATDVVKQGGKRRGANMGILRVDHPDVIDFITAKESEAELANFNISVGLTEKFMEAIEKNEDYEILNPRTKEPINKLNARRVFNLIVTMAWKNGEPGIIFLDRLNSPITNPTPHIGEIESTNPCGEQPLLPFESCNLGSINLERHVKDGQVNWDKLKTTVHHAVHFLDNVIDMNQYPLEQIKEMVHANRKIGMGVMGWADMLIRLNIPYNSQEGIELAEKMMKFIDDQAKIKSVELAKTRGTFSNFPGSTYDTNKPEDLVRNATRTTIAPTGSIGIIAGASSGIEPLFAISFIRKTPQFELLEVNPLFEEIARKKGFYTEDLMKKIARKGSIQNIDEVPDDIKKVFVTAMDITPEDHIKMQAAFQRYVNNAVSKTINFPFDATTEEISDAYLLAWKLGCKGITIYRDGSRDMQVLNIERDKKPKKPEDELEPSNVPEGHKKSEAFFRESENGLETHRNKVSGAQKRQSVSRESKSSQRETSESLTVGEDYAGGCAKCNL